MSETTEIIIPPVAGTENIADLVRKVLVLLGEDPNREGLRRTPERFEKALRFLTSGYRQDPEKLLNGAMFSVCYDEMVVVKDIEVYSLCEHHLLPFFGRCHVAYIPVSYTHLDADAENGAAKRRDAMLQLIQRLGFINAGRAPCRPKI